MIYSSFAGSSQRLRGLVALLRSLWLLLTPDIFFASMLQADHNARVAKEARAEFVCGHILALPFSDKYTGELGIEL